MTALNTVTEWPVDHVAAAILTPEHGGITVDLVGDPERRYRLASLSKPMSAWAVMVGVEEGIVELDAPLRWVAAAEGATLRHLLSHASGFGFDGDVPVTEIGRRRMYSNTGIERATDELAAAAGMPFEQYLREAVFEPLGMASADLRGSPAHAVWCSLDDVVRFVAEMLRPRLLAASTYHDVISPQYPELGGIVPDVGRFDPCPWGLGVEIRGAKAPHWTGRANSAATFGHFGGAGTMMWVDPLADLGVAALTDRPFDEWRDEALVHWPAFADAALAEARG
ncbi:MAG: serine hydrolase domain-containing protein [Ilumatobacter sp.]|uniref:serine hydrolase domain-containing protein n=1 Tax=Ilumatobacter sp. TaxID=1967498 RepID=UPI0026194671|nr:serine hydrolase domain-containing protein [Ilumatobacter sp.]MDJ0770583.1 serine hydrolase domain-containing protein [Ilumatobacter sp.]